MRTAAGIAWLLVAVGLGSALRSQSQANPWDGVYTKLAGGSLEHNAFLARMIEGRPVGRALDIGIGEGRSAFFLASNGWDVTGVDVSAAGIALARARPRRGARRSRPWSAATR